MSIALPSQPFRPASLPDRRTVTQVLAAPLRSVLETAANRVRSLRRAAAARALRERALARMNTDPGYAEDLLAAARLLDAGDGQA